MPRGVESNKRPFGAAPNVDPSPRHSGHPTAALIRRERNVVQPWEVLTCQQGPLVHGAATLFASMS